MNLQRLKVGFIQSSECRNVSFSDLTGGNISHLSYLHGVESTLNHLRGVNAVHCFRFRGKKNQSESHLALQSSFCPQRDPGITGRKDESWRLVAVGTASLWQACNLGDGGNWSQPHVSHSPIRGNNHQRVTSQTCSEHVHTSEASCDQLIMWLWGNRIFICSSVLVLMTCNTRHGCEYQ